MDDKTTNNNPNDDSNEGGTTAVNENPHHGYYQQHKKKDDRREEDHDPKDGDSDNKVADMLKNCRKFWQEYKSGKIVRQQALEQTSFVLSGAVDEYFIQPYKTKCRQLDEARLQIKSLTEELHAKTRENERLQESDKKKTESMQSLIKAVGNSNEQSREDSQAMLIEAKLRGELLQVTVERDEKSAALMDETRKNRDLQEDCKIIKAKYQKEQTEKVAIERDYRTLKSTVARFRGSGSDDADYYKQKYENEKLKSQSQKSLLEDKDREISYLKRDRDRHLSQNVLASIRAANNGGLSSSTTACRTAGGGMPLSLPSKKGRYS